MVLITLTEAEDAVHLDGLKNHPLKGWEKTHIMARPTKYTGTETERRRAARDVYKKSPLGKAAQKRYAMTENGKACLKAGQAKYHNTWKGRATRLAALKRGYCKKNGIEYDLDRDWILERLRGTCEITGLPFKHQKHVPGKSKPGPGPKSPSIDRIDPAKGYTKDNCRMVLHCVNMFKFTMSDGQLEKIAWKVAKGLKKKRMS